MTTPPSSGPPTPPRDAAPRKKGKAGKVVTTVLVLGLAGGGTYGYLEWTGKGDDLPGVKDVTQEAAKTQATLVDQEDTRIMTVRASHESALQAGGATAAQVRQPYEANSANGQTLVLPQRREPYYVADLEKQKALEKQTDGSYLLSKGIIAADGAKVVLQNSSGPLTIRMRSIPGNFTALVSFGANFKVNGSPQNPVRFTSWNDTTRAPDTNPTDGRSYIRAIGGEFSMKHTQVSNLGFWSGRTGGLSLTGTDRPDSAAQRLTAATAPNRGVQLPNGGRDSTRGNRDEIEVTAPGGGKGTSFHVPAANLVSGVIDHTTITGNAYGLFVTASNQTQLTNNTIRDSLVHGVQLHRFAKNAVIENTTVSRSRGDGFVLSRGTEGVRVTNCTAEGNGGNGFSLNGEALSDGPSASGESINAFGGNTVISAIARNNRRYGVEILGGDSVSLQNSRIFGGDMGIVVRDKTTKVQISGNQIKDPARQGIVLRDQVAGGTVSGNVISGAETALYVRDASGAITGNTVQSASRHAVTLKGNIAGTQLSGNTLSGAGTSVMDVDEAVGKFTDSANNVKGWHKTAGFWTWVKRVFKPMNLIWFGVFLLVGVSMYRSRSSGMQIGRRGAHPYELQTKMEERPVRLLRRTAGSSAPGGRPPGAARAGAPARR
ncbi:right-handed parallel beta-helix repeat-containing protein [Spirillospora sp. CA-294931]|uniref:right-handed parallel beta-helix repeat-containing protein n=1 Tax=Spirillospora sp. CA-294931 TaxID=3240042 RepID=UPI003D8F6CCC